MTARRQLPTDEARDLLALTRDLVAIPSVSHEEAPLVDWLEAELRAAPWLDVERVVAVDGRRIKGLPGFRGLVFSLQDVSQYVEELQSLRRSAYVDALTGLPNRAAMWNAIQQAFRTRQNGSVLMVDLDDFKGINDRFGHAAGDQVLTTVAQRLRRAVHEIGTVAAGKAAGPSTTPPR